MSYNLGKCPFIADWLRKWKKDLKCAAVALRILSAGGVYVCRQFRIVVYVQCTSARTYTVDLKL